MWLLRVTRNLLRGFQWARDAADRLVRATCVLVAHAAGSAISQHHLYSSYLPQMLCQRPSNGPCST